MLAAGAVLRPQDLAALASIGMAEVCCFKRVRVGIVSTGDEVVRVGGVAFSIEDEDRPPVVECAEHDGVDEDGLPGTGLGDHHRPHRGRMVGDDDE